MRTHGRARWDVVRVTAAVAALALSGCSVGDILADRARDRADEIAAEVQRDRAAAESERPEVEAPGSDDEGPIGEAPGPDDGGPIDDAPEPDAGAVEDIDDAALRAVTYEPGRFTLGGEGYSLTLPEGFELGGNGGVHAADDDQRIQMLSLTGLTQDASQFETQLTAVREGPGGEVVYDAPTDVAGADRAHIVITDDGDGAIGNVVARSDTGSVLATYAASSGSFEPAIVGYMADELTVGLASLESVDAGAMAFVYPTADGQGVEARFELFDDWYLDTEQDLVLRRYVSEAGEEVEYRLVINDRVSLDGLVDELSSRFPEAEFDTSGYDVPGADEALLVDIDAADTDDRFVQRSILVGHDLGFTFQLTYVARPDVFDPEVADQHLGTFEVAVVDDPF